MNKQPEITDATRNTFIEAFCSLYAERSIERITVKEIVEKSGYSRATFYNYFKDAYDLLEYVENEFISSLMEKITSNIEKKQEMEDFVQNFVELIRSKRTYIYVFMSSSNSPSFVNRLKEKAVPVLLESFGVPAGNRTARYALEFYINGLIPLIGTWLRSGQELPIEDFALLVKGILQEGILAQLNR